jgi:hypothetical protein
VLDPGPVAVLGTQGRYVGIRRQAVGVGADGHHRVEPQGCEVGHVVPGERLVPHMAQDAAEAAQPASPGADAAPVGHLDTAGIPHHHVGDVTPTIDEDTYLTTRLVGECRQVAGELLRDESLGRETASAEALELADLTGLEALGITEDGNGRDLGGE